MLKFLTFLALITISLYSQNPGPWQPLPRPALELSLKYISADRQNYLYGIDNQWGLLRSTDLAKSWHRLNTPASKIKTVEVNSKGDIYYLIETDKGIYSSTNNGSKWNYSEINFRPPGFQVNCFTIGSDDVLFAGTSLGLYKSTDDGLSWVKDPAFLTSFFMQLNKKNDVIYAVQRDSSVLPENILVSKDNGLSWKKTPLNGKRILSNAEFCFGNNGLVFIRAMSEGDPWYLPQPWLIRSTDMGDTWTALKTNYSMYEIVQDGSGGLLAFAELLRGDGPSTPVGLFHSADNGLSWENYSTYFPSKTINSMIRINGNVYAVYDSYPFFTMDNGISWRQLSTGFSGKNINDLTTVRDWIFAAGYFDFFLSKDGGENWQNLSAGTLNNGGYIKVFNVSGDMFVRQYIYHWKQGYEDYLNKYSYNSGKWINIPEMKDVISIANNSKGKYFALTNSSSGKEGLYSSSDNGFTFQKLTGYDFSYTEPFSMVINSKDEIFITTRQTRLMKSTDSGMTFTSLNAGNKYQTKLLINSKDDLFLWRPLVRSSDNGITWDSLDNKLSNVAELFIDNNDGLYALVEPFPYHLYCSYDNGDSWKDITYNLNGRSISAVTLNDKGILFAATNDDQGLFKSDLNTLLTEVQEDITGLPSEYLLAQNYPNPFNPSTTITFSIPEAGTVTLKVFDILGKEILTLMNEEKNAGTYSVKFDAFSISSGLYIYRISVGSFTFARKMLLVK